MRAIKSSFMAVFLFLVLGVTYSRSQILPHPGVSGTQKPTVLQSNTGVPIVNIQTPSAAGVSRNVYQQFDVLNQGVVFNNSQTQGASRLAGWVGGNPWLLARPARVILNEVYSLTPSQLQGTLEVAGTNAELVICNPAGIVVNGSGFINVSRATLTTGIPSFNFDGSIRGYDIRDGEIRIEGKGLDASSTDYTAILGRAVKINASIWAKELQVSTGTGLVSPSGQGNWEAGSSESSGPKPTVSIDSSALGGMYADKIRLVGTEQGVGVNNAGLIYATAGNVEITADGLVVNSGKIKASETISVAGQQLENSGAMYSQGTTSIATREGVKNSGGVYSLDATRINAQGAVENSGVIASNGAVDIQAGSMNQGSSGTLVSGIEPQDIPWESTTAVSTGTNASKTLTVKTQGNFGSSGSIISGDTLSVTAGSDIRVNGQVLSKNDQSWEGSSLDLSQSRIQSGGNITFTGRDGTITTSTAGVEGANITIRAHGLMNDAGLVRAQNDLNISLGSGALTNSNSSLAVNGDGGLVAKNGSLSIQAADVTNDGGFMGAGNTFTATVSSWSNGTGAASALGDMSLSATGAVTNAGTLSSQGGMRLTAGSFSQTASGTTTSGGPMAVATQGNFSSAGTIVSGSTLSVLAGGPITVSGQVTTQGDQTWTGASLNLAQSRIQSATNIVFQGLQSAAITSGAKIWAQNVEMRTAGLINNAGLIQAEKNLVFSLGQAGLTNTNSGTDSGLIAKNGTLTITAGAVTNDGGYMGAGNTFTATISSWDNGAGTATSLGDMSLSATGAVTNAGTLSSQGTMQLAAGSFSQAASGATTSGGHMAVTTLGDFSSAGSITSGNTLSVQAGGAISVSGNVSSQDSQIWTGASLNLTNSRIQSATDITFESTQAAVTSGAKIWAQNISMQTAGLANNAGLIQANNTLTIALAGGALTNTNSGTDSGLIAKNGTLTITAGAVTNDGGYMGAGNTFTATISSWDNGAGTATSLGDLSLSATSAITNAGTLSSQGTMQLAAGSFSQAASGATTSGGPMAVTTLGDFSSAGSITSGNTLSVQAGGAISVSGNVSGQDSQTWTGASLNLANSRIQSAADITFESTQAAVTSGAKIWAQNISMQATGLANNAGLIQANNTLTIALAGGALTNTNSGTDFGLIAKNGTLTITAGAVTNDGGYMGAGNTFTATVSSWDNGTGTVASLGDLSLASAGAVNNSGTLSAQGSLQLTGTNFTQAASGRLLGGKTLRVALTQALVNAGLIDPTSTWIQAAAITNTGSGTISGDSIFLSSGTLANGSSATISATDTLNIGTGAVTNQGAMLSGGSMLLGGSLDALGHVQGQAGQVVNSGRMQAGGVLGLALSQGLDNSGSIYALGDAAVTAGGLVSSSGLLASQGTLAISAGSLSQGAGGTLGSGVDQHGNLITPAVGTSPDLLVFVQGGYASQGAVLSAGKLSVQAGSGITQTGSVSTLGDQTWSGASLNFSGARVQGGGTLLLQDQGVFITNGATIMAKNVKLNAAGLINDASLIQAENNLTLSLGGGSLVNANSGSSYGLIAKSGNLAITAGSVTNNGGYMAAGNTFTATVASWDNGTGTATSLGNLSLTSSGAINNTGTISAMGDLALTGTYLGLTRDASLTAGGTLRADISGTIDNRGLIDADFTWLTAQTLNNTGTGVIYGDRVAIGAGTLNNAYDSVSAAIASRGQLDIGAGTLNNQGVYDGGNHTASTGLILSMGDMAIGGGLDGSGRATGMGGTLINNGATIESMGNMSIAMGGIQNLNIHLTVTQVTRPDVPASTGPFMTPFGWSFFTGTETDVEDVASEYNPGIIRSGGSMSISAGSILNKDSQILAGGDLSIQGAAIDNQATQGNRMAHFVGIITYGAGALIYQVPWAYDESTTIDLTFQGYPVALSQGSLNMTSGGAPGQAGTGGMGNTQGMGAAGSAAMPFWAYGPGSTQPQNSLALTSGPGATQSQNSLALPFWTFGPGSILPQNSLYRIDTNPGASVVIQTDPRFLRGRQYLSSAYMLSQLTAAPVTTRLLGDGFYELSLVRGQIAQETGRRFLDGYRDDETEYQALMKAGIAFGNQYGLQAGAALSPEMQAKLTQDIVWLVAEEVPLPDGTSTTALVPKFYSALDQDHLAKAGGLIASDKNLAMAGTDIANSGTIAGRDTLSLSANTIQNTGTLDGGVVAARTQGDFTQIGGSIRADQGILLDVGRDLIMRSTVSDMNMAAVGGSVSVSNNIDRVSSMSVTGPNGIIDITAGGKLGMYGAQITNGVTPGGDLGGTGVTSITAGSIDLGTVGLSSAFVATTGKGFMLGATSTEYGSSIIGSGAVQLVATDGDITLRNSAVASGSSTLLAALDGSIYLTPGQSVLGITEKSKSNSSSGLTSTTKSLAVQDVQVQSLGSVVSSLGDVTAVAKDTIEVNGSQIFGLSSTYLEADHIRNIASTDISANLTVQKSSSTGVAVSGGSMTFGSTDAKLTRDGVYAGLTPSVIGATGSDVTIIAHEDYLQQGSTLYADTLYLKAKQASILAQPGPYTEGAVIKSSSSGLTMQVSNPILDAGMTMWNTAQSMGQVSSSSALAVGGLTLGLAGYNAYDDLVRAGKGVTQTIKSDTPLAGTGLGSAIDSANSMAGSVGGLDISIKFGASQSETSQMKVGMSQVGSKILANTIVLDIGDPANPNAQALTIMGSDVLASGGLFAKVIGNTYIGSSQNIQTMTGKNSSSGFTTGVGVSLGNDGTTVYASTGYNASQGKESGNDQSNTYSHLGGAKLTVFDISGDLTMPGGVILGDTIKGNVGGNLIIKSPQDLSNYNSSQTSLSASASIGWNLSTWTPRGGASVSVSQDNVKAIYESVGDEQAGIKAGDGGFNITVGGYTQLLGAVISSSQKAVDDKLNYFSTNGLYLSDLENKSTYSATSVTLSAGYDSTQSTSKTKGFFAGMPMVLSSSSSDWGTTYAGISGGTIINNGNETIVDSTLNFINTSVRTGDSSGRVENVFDLNKIKNEFAIGRALSQEASKFLSNRAQELDAAQKAYDVEWNKGDQADPMKLEQLGKAADAAKEWGPGGTYRLVFTAMTSAFSGNMGGSAAQAMQSAVITAVQGLGTNAVKGFVDNYEEVAGPAKGEALRTALQAIVGCAGAAASGGSCGAGALGASASVVLNNLADLATSTAASDLSAQEKEARMNLINSLVGGTTAALGGDTTAAVLAARVEQENNYAALLTIWPEIGAELPAIAQKLQQIAPGLAQLIFSVNANDGSDSGRKANPGENLFEEPSKGQGGGGPGQDNQNTPSTEASTGRTVPKNLNEQLAMEQARSNPTQGTELTNVNLQDPRWPSSDGWVKMVNKINDVEIHWVRNKITGAVADFKFKY
jgi:filamentous hemagglutinin